MLTTVPCFIWGGASLRYHVSYGVVPHAYTGAWEAVAEVATGAASALAGEVEAVAAPAGTSVVTATAATALGAWGPDEPTDMVYDGLMPLLTPGCGGGRIYLEPNSYSSHTLEWGEGGGRGGQPP